MGKHISISGIDYDIGKLIDYQWTNEEGFQQDKVKYRLAQQNNLLIKAVEAMANHINELEQRVGDINASYAWVSDSETIVASGDDTILVFYTSPMSIIENIQNSVGDLETCCGEVQGNINTLTEKTDKLESDMDIVQSDIEDIGTNKYILVASDGVILASDENTILETNGKASGMIGQLESSIDDLDERVTNLEK